MHNKQVNYNGREGADPAWDDGCLTIILVPIAALIALVLTGSVWSGFKEPDDNNDPDNVLDPRD